MNATGQILVIRGGAIGDFILTLPVLAALRRQFPEARLEVLGYPHIAGLAEWGGVVDAVRSIEARSMASFFVPGAELPAGQIFHGAPIAVRALRFFYFITPGHRWQVSVESTGHIVVKSS